MILVLDIISSEKGSWLAVKNGQIIFFHSFNIDKGEDQSLLYLEKMLSKNKLKLHNFFSFILLIKEASLTQVKVFTTMANTLAWNFNWPIVAEYYFSATGGQENNMILNKALKKLSKIKKFKAISAKYYRQAEITISKKKAKYKISK